MNRLIVTITVFTLITSPIDAKDKCNAGCLTKTYCLSPSGSNQCSKNNLVSATWSVIEDPSFYDDDTVGLTLVAENFAPSEVRSISLVFKSSIYLQSLTNYTCFKSSVGHGALVVQKSSTSTEIINKGSEHYSNKVLTCTWSFSIYDNIWPLYNEHPALLINDHQGIIELHSGSQNAIVATNVSELPIYHFQYLNCCNNVHGNGDYLTAFNQTTYNYYLMRPIASRPKMLTLSMNMTSGIQLIFTCDFNQQKINSYLSNGNIKTPIDNILYGKHINNALNPRCFWYHPLTLLGTFGNVSTVRGVFDMKIISDGKVVYTEKNVSFIDIDNNSSSKLFTFTSVVIMIISMILNWSL